MIDLDLDKKVTNVSVDPNENSVKVEWADGHQGVFSEAWLLERSFSKENRQKRTPVPRDDPELLGADYKIQRDDFQVGLIYTTYEPNS